MRLMIYRKSSLDEDALDLASKPLDGSNSEVWSNTELLAPYSYMSLAVVNT